MIGIIPLVMIGAFSLFKQERKYQFIAREINQAKAPASNFKHIGSLSIFNIPTDQIKYIEAFQNYVKIGYINAEGQLKIQTERITLKEILTKTKGSSIIRCHRSYLVNKEAIVAASGNAQGLSLSLSDCDKRIPVSRSCVPVFRDQ
jgi:DNA-binding LytR/AlgR family response regulator